MNQLFAQRFMLSSTLIFGLIIGLITLKNIKVGSILKHITPPPVPVKVILLKQQPWPLIIEQPGTIKAHEEVMLSALMSGHIDKIFIQPGQYVEKNQPILKLDDLLYQAQLKKAKASYELARLNLIRDQQLYEEKTIPTSVYNASVALFNQAQADVEEAQTQVHYHTIRAPFPGIIDYFDLNLGDYVQVGQQLIQLYAKPPYDVEFSLPQEYFSLMKPHQPILVTIADQTYTALLSSKGQGVSAQSRRFLNRAQLPKKSLAIPGQYVNVKVEIEEEAMHFVVPETVIDYTTLGSVVWEFIPDHDAAKTGQVVPIEVTVYRTNNNASAIKGAGLHEQMALVSLGQLKLQPESKVIIHD
jgi:membrane fusion protein (multidrug efflux system)